MATNEIPTKVKVTGDPSGLDKIGRAAKEAFSPLTAKQFGRAAKEVDRELKRLVGTQVRLTRELRGIERGTKQYAKLTSQLEEAGSEAKQLKALLGDINKITSRPRRQGFIAGMAQGAGIAQYIPTGPGMGARMGGALVGGMARRAAGGAAAPFASPGVGGFAGLLGAIPGIGGAASASLMAGYGYFQKAIAFDRARIANLPYAQIGRRRVYRRSLRGGGGGPVSDAAIRASTTISPQIVRQMEEEDRVSAGLRGVGKIYGKQAVAEGGDTIADLKRQIAHTTSPAMKKMLQADLNEKIAKKNVAALYPATAPKSGWTRVKSAEEKKVEANIKKHGRYIPERAAAAKGKWVTQTTTGLPSERAGVPYGFTPGETQGIFGEYMGARGGIGRGRTEFRDVMVAKRLFGVGAGLAGGYGRMLRPGGGGEGLGLAGSIATALAAGLRGSQIPEYLQTLVTQGKQMESEGVKFNIQDLTAGAMTMRALGFQGMQAPRVMGQMQAAARGVSARGVQGPMDLLMARAAGYTPEGGAESYAAAMNRMAGGLSPEMMEGLLGQITQGAGGGEWGGEMQTMLVRRALGQMGVQVGPGQARKLLAGFEGGRMTEGARSVLAQIQTEAGGYTAGGFAAQARVGAKATGGLAVRAAGLEATQIGAGRGLASTFITLEDAGMKAVKALSNFSPQLQQAAKIVLEAFKEIEKYTEMLSAMTTTFPSLPKPPR